MSFTHQRLEVYQIAKDFLAFRYGMIIRAMRKVAAIDHLQRAGESVILNIVHSTETWSPKERMTYLGYANGSALECAACLDILGIKKLCVETEVGEGKGLLRDVVNMLTGMASKAAQQLKEERAQYGMASEGIYFAHEKLGVYLKTLAFIGRLDHLMDAGSPSRDLIAKIDKSSTSILLNISEGNGRFAREDQASFLATAHKSAVQTAGLIDVADLPANKTNAALDSLHEICRMLIGLKRAVVRRDAYGK